MKYKGKKAGPPTTKAIDPAKELKKFSPIELDWVKDKAIKKESIQLQKRERLLELQMKAQANSMNQEKDKGKGNK